MIFCTSVASYVNSSTNPQWVGIMGPWLAGMRSTGPSTVRSTNGWSTVQKINLVIQSGMVCVKFDFN